MSERVYKLEGIVTARGRIMQSGTQKAGAHTLLPTKDVWYKDDVVPMPYISANSIRGKLRRMIMEDMCRQLDYKFKDDRIWHAFFGGGQLKGGGDGMIDASWRLEIVEKIPPVSLWAFSLGNQMIEGKLIVFDMDICCEENKVSIPGKYHDMCTGSFYQAIGSTFFTRRDDKHDGTIKDEDSPAIQMKIEVQSIVPGTRFYHAFMLRHYPSTIEKACLHRAINLWNEFPAIGGKSSSGYGLVELGYGSLDDKPYTDYLANNKVGIVRYLDKMTTTFQQKADRLAGKSKKTIKVKEKDKPGVNLLDFSRNDSAVEAENQASDGTAGNND
jgi:CRISPR/Cas system CSM-associated protein Csm3 (group 7 of RAMP superfamily)